MTDVRYIHVRNWDRFQHPDVTRGKSRGAPWIKDYTAQDDDDDYRRLTLAERGLLHALRRAYARRKCSGMPSNTLEISRVVGAQVTRKMLESLNHAGFIVFSASKLQADFQENSTLDADADKEPPVVPQTGGRTETVHRVFENWQRKTGHERTKLTQDRVRKITARLREGYSEDELLLVPDGANADPWQDRHLHNDIGVLYRDAQHVDKFIALAHGNGHFDTETLEARELAQRLMAQRVSP